MLLWRRLGGGWQPIESLRTGASKHGCWSPGAADVLFLCVVACAAVLRRVLTAVCVCVCVCVCVYVCVCVSSVRCTARAHCSLALNNLGEEGGKAIGAAMQHTPNLLDLK